MRFIRQISLILTVFLLISVNLSSSFSIGTNTIEHTIYTPLSQIAGVDSIALNVVSKSDFKRTLENKYSTFSHYNSNLWTTANSRGCVIGGNYTLNVLISATGLGVRDIGNVTLFSCNTINDIITKIKIPAAWSTDNLTLYCNDGAPINFKQGNFDFLTSGVNSYKVCILKNFDKDKTGVYGFDVGNQFVDSNRTFYFDNNTAIGGIIDNSFTLNLTSPFTNNIDKFTFSSNLNQNSYFFTYNQSNGFFILRDSNEILNTNLNSIFTKDIGISRVAIFKQLKNKQIYGFEKGNYFTDSITPVYSINYNGFLTLTSVECANYFKKFLGKSQTNLQKSDLVLCRNNNEILINSNAIDGINYGSGTQGQVSSFNIFKNIIMGFEN